MELKGRIFAVGFLLLSSAVNAASISSVDIIANWAQDASPVPATGPQLGDWNESGGIVSSAGNTAASLVSDFSAMTDFIFSVESRQAGDDDGFGIMWGTTDLSNHYRLTWSRDFGEDGTTSNFGLGGFIVVKEQGGVGTVLFDSSEIYSQGSDYRFTISGANSGFDILVEDVTSTTITVFSESIFDTTFTTGFVGIHELFQAGGTWTNFDFVQGAPVPLPAPFLLFGSALAGLGWFRRRSS